MLSQGVQPNKASYHCMIEAHAKAGNMAAAKQWLDEMMFHGIHPDETTCAVLLRAGKSETMSGVEFTCWVHASIVKAYLAVGNAERAQLWLNELRRSGLNPREVSPEELVQVSDFSRSVSSDMSQGSGVAGRTTPVEPHLQLQPKLQLDQLLPRQLQPEPSLLSTAGPSPQWLKDVGCFMPRTASKGDAIINGGTALPLDKFPGAPLLHGRLQGISDIVRFSV